MGRYYLDLGYKITDNNDQKRNLTPVIRLCSMTIKVMFSANTEVKQ